MVIYGADEMTLGIEQEHAGSVVQRVVAALGRHPPIARAEAVRCFGDFLFFAASALRAPRRNSKDRNLDHHLAAIRENQVQ